MTVKIPEFSNYERELTHIRLGNTYAKDLLRSRGWKQVSDDVWCDPVKHTNVPDLENAFFTQIVREIARG